MTAALKYPSPEFAGALLGVEQSARGFRWVERLDPGRTLVATSIEDLESFSNVRVLLSAA